MEKVNDKLTLEDCKIDRDNYREVDIYGYKIQKQSREEAEEQKKAVCGYNESSLITQNECYDYMYIDYYYDLLEEYCKQQKLDDHGLARLGLVKMFNDGWVTSPVFVNWHRSDVGFFMDVFGYWIESWLFKIHDAQKQVDILKHIIKNAQYIYGSHKKEQLPHLNALLDKCLYVAKEQKEEAKKRAAAEKLQAKAKKEKPEYVLSAEEIIQYVLEENPDAAPAVRAMLRYFADEKDGWNTKAIKALLEPIKAQNFNFYASVGNAIGNVKHLNTNNNE